VPFQKKTKNKKDCIKESRSSSRDTIPAFQIHFYGIELEGPDVLLQDPSSITWKTVQSITNDSKQRCTAVLNL